MSGISFPRIRFRFSLRGLLLLVAAVAVLCAWQGRRLYHWRLAMAAAQTIREQGGDVAMRRTGRAMVLPWLGSPWADDVDGVTLDGHRADGDSLGALHYLPSLRVLRFQRTRFREEIVLPVSRLKSLEVLLLMGAGIGPQDIARLPVYPRITTIGLTNEQIGPESATWLARQPSLSTLVLQGTRWDGSSLGLLRTSANARALILECDELTEDGLRELAAWTSLTNLVLQVNQPELSWVPFASMRGLQLLDVRGPSISMAAHETLQRSLPDTVVRINGLLAFPEIQSGQWEDFPRNASGAPSPLPRRLVDP